MSFLGCVAGLSGGKEPDFEGFDSEQVDGLVQLTKHFLCGFVLHINNHILPSDSCGHLNNFHQQIQLLCKRRPCLTYFQMTLFENIISLFSLCLFFKCHSTYSNSSNDNNSAII